MVCGDDKLQCVQLTPGAGARGVPSHQASLHVNHCGRHQQVQPAHLRPHRGTRPLSPCRYGGRACWLQQITGTHNSCQTSQKTMERGGSLLCSRCVSIVLASRASGCHLDTQTLKNQFLGRPNSLVGKFLKCQF